MTTDDDTKRQLDWMVRNQTFNTYLSLITLLLLAFTTYAVGDSYLRSGQGNCTAEIKLGNGNIVHRIERPEPCDLVEMQRKIVEAIREGKGK